MSNPPPPIPITLQYATPTDYQSEGIWREGNRLAARVNPGGTLRLPLRCVKCNAYAERMKSWQKTMYWHPPGFYALILFPGLWIYILVALIIRKKVTVATSLCTAHNNARRKRVAIGWAVAVAGIACIVAAIYFGNDPAWRRGPLGMVFTISAIVLILFSLFWAVLATGVLAVRKMKDGRVWFSGAGDEFLASL